jgi:uncharacterized protein (UPF0333 family)
MSEHLLELVLRCRGQTSSEYLGVLLVVAAIIAAIFTTDPGHEISDKLSAIVRDIAGGR